jgi:hypothetical protein
MAHWAEIDENNVVVRVLVGSNDEPDEGYTWLIENLGGRWLKTSFNTVAGVHLNGDTPLRKNFAGIGFTYDEQRDAFIPPQPEQKETRLGKPIVYDLDEDTCQWVRKVIES